MGHLAAHKRAWLCAAGLVGCAGSPATTPDQATGAKAARARKDGAPHLRELGLSGASPRPTDGEDDGARPWAGFAGPVHFEALDTPPDTAHPVVCDLVGFSSALYVSHATDVIDRTGARVHRYDPTLPAGQRWSLAFDYDQPGRHGGGQGFPRVRAIGGRVLAVDGDSTSAGFFGVSDEWLETYVFRSDYQGQFQAIGPQRRAPAGLLAAPMAFHLFDIIDYRGLLVVSGGTMDGRRRYPAGLWLGTGDDRVLERRHVMGHGHGVVRSTYMHRYRGRLYIGFQNNEKRVPFDLAVIEGDPATHAPRLARATEHGGWMTRRFASGKGVLYWVASAKSKGRPASLFVSNDGIEFSQVDLPVSAGVPQDVVVSDRGAYVLTTKGLYLGNRTGPYAQVAPAPPGDPFGHFEEFCSAPMAQFGEHLVAGSTRDGRVYAIGPTGLHTSAR